MFNITPRIPNRIVKTARLLWLTVTALLAVSCVSAPKTLDNICDMFTENRDWYQAAKSSSERWGGPLSIPMAIIYQESRFVSDAKPPMRYFLGFIPYGRTSSAYGYAQAQTGTWDEYQQDAGSIFSDRDDFEDAIDFVFWYMNKTNKKNKVSKWDAYHQYLNYHEGHGGYARGTYKHKSWLSGVAKKVEERSKNYSAQYSQCKEQLDQGWLKRMFS